jgi:hypothetical protein
MTELAGRRTDVGTNLNMHRHLFHDMTQSIDGLNVVGYQQDSDSRWPGRDIFSIC